MHRRVCLGKIPVLTLHSVRRHVTENLGDLTLPDDVFELLLQSLQAAGYQSIRCSELLAHLDHDAPLPQRSVLLTFDDGYLDNHTVAAPLLRKYGFFATVFVATSMLHPEEVVRPTTDDTDSPLETGFLSATEIFSLEKDGVFEFQSHSHGHDRVAISAEVVDFHRPDAPCWWLLRQRSKLEDRALEEERRNKAERVPWGVPVRKSAWACEAAAFHAQENQENLLTTHVASHGGAAFFKQNDWRAQLQEIVESTPAQGMLETTEERKKRVLIELKQSKEILEDMLGRTVPYLAWPGGGIEAQALRWALQDAGYEATFGTNRSCHGVTPNRDAIPRAYFRQNYRGHFDRSLRVQLARGILDWEAGRISGYLRSAAVRRLMGLCKNPAFPNQPRTRPGKPHSSSPT